VLGKRAKMGVMKMAEIKSQWLRLVFWFGGHYWGKLKAQKTAVSGLKTI
jgi:hypothetical protein